MVILAAAFSPLAVFGETVEEKYENGRIKIRFETTRDKKNGSYEEFFESGQPRVVASYKQGELDGEYVRYHENGKIATRANYRKGKKHGAYVERSEEGQPLLTVSYSAGKRKGKQTIYRDGKRHWEYAWKKGELLKINDTKTQLHTLKDVKKGLAKVYKAKVKLRSAPEEHVAALRRLNAYRFLCGLPADITLEARQSYHCQAAAELLKLHGQLDHTPPKPAGMGEKRYQEGFLGTTRSNLALGTDLAVSIDHYFYDSDNFNIGNIGHRRWCMNPEMRTTGFGRHENFCVMWSMDNRRRPVPDHLFIAYPPQGYLPLEYFSTHHAWSVSLNKKYIQSNETSKATIYPLDENLVPGEPLELAHHSYVGEAAPNVDMGPENVLVFKPESLDLSPGNRYAVEVTGITDNNDKEIKLHYVVEFIELD